MTETDTKT